MERSKLKRDRHGRARGTILHPGIPAWRTRAERFDDIVSMEVATYRRVLGEVVDRWDYAVLDVPESDPTPWEHGIPQARYFPLTGAPVEGRVVLYRRPICYRAPSWAHITLLVHAIITQQLANLLGRPEEEIDYHNVGDY